MATEPEPGPTSVEDEDGGGPVKTFLEHLEDPAGALDVLAGLARPWLLASVPREPLWRVLNCARGKYWADWGNTPGHLQHWSRSGFLAFLERRFQVVEARSPLPWTVALCRAP